MINLLADERKNDIKAARVNVIILRYTVILALAFAFIIGALYVSYTILTVTKANAETVIESNDVKADVYSETKQQVDALSTQLSGAKSLLDQEVRYSQILVQLGQIMPAGTIIGDMTLTAESFSGNSPVEIKAFARTTAEASQLQTQFQGSSLFSQVSLNSTEASDEVEGYDVTVSLTVTFRPGGR